MNHRKENNSKVFEDINRQRREKIDEINALISKVLSLSDLIERQLIGKFGSLNIAREKSKEKILKTRLQDEEHQKNLGLINFARKNLEAMKTLGELITNLTMWQDKIKYKQVAVYQITFSNLWSHELRKAEQLNKQAQEYINW